MATGAIFDEMTGRNGGGKVRPPYRRFQSWFGSQDLAYMRDTAGRIEADFRRLGITFAVNGDREAEERLIPFDLIPRILSATEWATISAGIEQRVRALNAFLHDIYHRQEILRAGVVPTALIARNDAFVPQMVGFMPPGGVYTHVVGVDLVRTGPNAFFALEDNARTPSGVSYMLQNRETMLNAFPELFASVGVCDVTDYPHRLRLALEAAAPGSCDDQPVVAVLTPGLHNSAYFEHAFLADQMGAQLVEASDLRVFDGFLTMRTTRGHRRIDVLYRRVDDPYLDPLTFRPDSMLGVAGLMDVYRSGRVTIANAPGTGIADDKAIYTYMPEIVRFYTGERPLLGNVPTWRCTEPEALRYVLAHLSDLVVKEVHGSGGYGMLVGPTSTRAEIAEFRTRLEARPDNYIAQPTLALSTAPILDGGTLSPRHIDLRPFVLVTPDRVEIPPGGLTRVALTKGSLVVNSSQGGGTKDTWVLEGVS